MKVQLYAAHDVEGNTAFTVHRVINLPFFPPGGLVLWFGDDEVTIDTPEGEGGVNHIWIHNQRTLDVAGKFSYGPAPKDKVEEIVGLLWHDGWRFSHIDWNDLELRVRLAQKYDKARPAGRKRKARKA